MSRTLIEGNRLSGQPDTSETSISHRKTFETALQRSQNYLLSIQKPEGFWVGELMVDSTLVSKVLRWLIDVSDVSGWPLNRLPSISVRDIGGSLRTDDWSVKR